VDADGSTASSFAANITGTVTAITPDSDGRILIGGAFTLVNGTARTGLARLGSDGSLDTAFAPAINGTVHTISLLANGEILIGGSFRIGLSTADSYFARLSPDGNIVPSSTTASGPIRSLLTTADGRIFAGGAFTQFDGRRQMLIGRTVSTTSVASTATLSDDRTTFQWRLDGPAGNSSSVTLETSTNGATWTTPISGIQMPSNTWRFNLPTALPANALNFLRLQSILPTSQGGSVSRYTTAFSFYNSTLSGPAHLANSGGSLANWTLNGSAVDQGTGIGHAIGIGSGGSGSGTGGGSGGGNNGGGGGAHSFHLSNLSIRCWPEENKPFITGISVPGTADVRLLVRAVGTTLEKFGVAPTMSEPSMTIFDRTGSALSTVASWNGNPAVALASENLGAFPLPLDSTDVSIFRTFSPGTYTFHVSAGNGLNGVALGEVYFGSDTGGLANISARAPIGAGSATCIVGFIIGGEAPRKVLVRGVGPSLAKYGVENHAPNPRLRVFDSAGQVIAFNEDWQHQSSDNTAAQMVEAAENVFAFQLFNSSTDAATVLTLPPGAYTVHVTGDSPGEVLAEVYEIP